MHTMLKNLAVAGALALALLSAPAFAQTSPNLTQNQKLTPAQWNNLFASKQDTLGYIPLNSAGGTMTGRLITAVSGATTAGLNLTPGTAPASPEDGDLWVTGSGFFARVNGSTLSLGASSGSVTSVALSLPSFITVTGSPVTISGTLTGTLATQTANTVFAGPTTGAAAAPTFRALVAADIPTGILVASTGLTGGTLNFGGTIAVDKATASNYYAGTSNKVVTTDIIYPAEVTITYGATTTFDFGTFINGIVTLTGNITTQTFSGVTAGKSGSIRFQQSGAGSFTTVWNSILKWPGGSAPSLTTGSATAIDVLTYNCVSATYCQAALAKDVK